MDEVQGVEGEVRRERTGVRDQARIPRTTQQFAIMQQSLLDKPVWQMTGEELLFLAQHGIMSTSGETATASSSQKERRYVYGLAGIARLFGCSLPTANRIKQSGKINRAITQIGRKIIVDADLALELAGRKTGGR